MLLVIELGNWIKAFLLLASSYLSTFGGTCISKCLYNIREIQMCRSVEHATITLAWASVITRRKRKLAITTRPPYFHFDVNVTCATDGSRYKRIPRSVVLQLYVQRTPQFERLVH